MATNRLNGGMKMLSVRHSMLARYDSVSLSSMKWRARRPTTHCLNVTSVRCRLSGTNSAESTFDFGGVSAATCRCANTLSQRSLLLALNVCTRSERAVPMRCHNALGEADKMSSKFRGKQLAGLARIFLHSNSLDAAKCDRTRAKMA